VHHATVATEVPMKIQSNIAAEKVARVATELKLTPADLERLLSAVDIPSGGIFGSASANKASFIEDAVQTLAAHLKGTSSSSTPAAWAAQIRELVAAHLSPNDAPMADPIALQRAFEALVPAPLAQGQRVHGSVNRLVQGAHDYLQATRKLSSDDAARAQETLAGALGALVGTHDGAVHLPTSTKGFVEAFRFLGEAARDISAKHADLTQSRILQAIDGKLVGEGAVDVFDAHGQRLTRTECESLQTVLNGG
jgi:hypothetical protein